MSQPRLVTKSPPHPQRKRRPQNGKSSRISTPTLLSSSKKISPKHTMSRHRSYSNPSVIPRLPRINRLSVTEEMKLAESVGMTGMTSHNLACIVNSTEKRQSSSFFTDFIFDENDVSCLIDPTPPSYLEYAAKRKITPCLSRRQRMASSKTKFPPFRTMSDLKRHRFHLAELFQNDAETNRGLTECFDKIPSYFFASQYSALPSPSNTDSDSDSNSSSSNNNNNNMNLLLRDCKNHKILRNQQKLANYLDIVEVNLLKQICIQSDSFFSGLENIQLLQNDVMDILNNIQYLRTNLDRMQEYEVMSWSNIMNLAIKCANCNNLLNVTEDVHNVQILYSKLNKLISQNKYCQSVRIFTETKRIINGYHNSIHVFNVFEKRLLKIESALSIKLIYKMCDIAIELNENEKKHKNNQNNNENNQTQTELFEKYVKSCILLQCPSKSVQMIYNTLRTKFDDELAHMYSFETSAHIGNISMTCNIENYVHTLEDDNEYIIVLHNIYLLAEIILLSMQSICHLFTSFVSRGSFCNSDSGSCYAPHMNASTMSRYNESSSTYCKSLCCEVLSLSSLLLQSRNRKNSLMTLYRVKSVFAKTLGFLKNIESITNTTCYEIRGVILKQAQCFLDHFDEERRRKLVSALEIDKWSSVRVPFDVQSEVDQLQSGVKQQRHHHHHDRDRDDDDDDDIATSGSEAGVELEAIIIHIWDKSVLAKTAMNACINYDEDVYSDVDDLRFKSVSSLLCLCRLVYEYIECASKLPPIAYDVENKLISLFTIFNTKTCHLVLGAGAMKSVKLKAITAKHLALAQQCISVLLILLPNIHKKWFSKIIPRNCLPLIQSSIARLMKDLEEHSNEIFKKLIAIMQQLIDYKFDAFDAYLFTLICHEDVRVHASISSLMAECRKMYRLMSTYMQSYQISIIFKPIVAQFHLKIKQLIHKLQLNQDNQDQQNLETIKKKDKEKENHKQAFHSLNMAIKFISDKLTRLNCDAAYLAELCIEID